MGDIVPGLIRTYVPVAVAALVTFLASVGVVVPDDTSAALATFLGGLAGAIYYTLIRLLEKKYPWVGNFLGSAKAPVYVDPKDIEPENAASVVSQVTEKVDALYTDKTIYG
jgi:hypothetical protein